MVCQKFAHQIPFLIDFCSSESSKINIQKNPKNPKKQQQIATEVLRCKGPLEHFSHGLDNNEENIFGPIPKLKTP